MTTTGFVVDRMTTEHLLQTLVRLVKFLDPQDPLYDIRKAHNIAVNTLDIALELGLRGTQLSLFAAYEEQPRDSGGQVVRHPRAS